jgi:hypothetical protein
MMNPNVKNAQVTAGIAFGKNLYQILDAMVAIMVTP